VEVPESAKRTSLLRYGIHYDRTKFYETRPRRGNYIEFTVRQVEGDAKNAADDSKKKVLKIFFFFIFLFFKFTSDDQDKQDIY